MNIKKILAKIFNSVFLGAEAFCRLAYFTLAALVIIGLTYVFGFHLLVGVLKGGDAGYAAHNVVWFARWFPKIPIWYPSQGGGFAFTLSYAVVPSLLAVLVQRLTSLDLTQALKVITFGSYLLGAFGVYFLASWRMKNQTIGLMASVLFLTISGTWFWITKLGYYAFAITTGFIPWGLVFFDWFLEALVEKQKLLKVFVKLFLASLVLGLAFFFHTFVGASLAMGYFFYGPIVGWLTNKKLLSLRGVFEGIAAAFLVSFFSVLLFAFWFFPVFRYSQLAARGGLQTEPAEQLIRWAQVQNWRRLLFDYSQPEPTDVFPQPSFPKLLVRLVFLGLPIALVLRIRKKFFPARGQSKVLGWSALGFLFLFWSSLPAYLKIDQVEKLRFIFSWLQYRVISVSYAVFPVVAAFAIYGLFWILTEIIFWPLLLFRSKAYWPRRILKSLTVGSLSILTFIFLLTNFESGFGPPFDPIGDERKKLGFESYYFKSNQEPIVVDQQLIRRILEPNYFFSLIKNSFAYSVISDYSVFPKKISSAGFGVGEMVEDVQAHMELDQFTRVGLTGNIGSLLQEWSSYTDSSTLNQFMYRGSLFQSMRGFSETVFFGKDERNHHPALASDLARWLGYRYSVTTPGVENTKHYLPPDWEETERQGGLVIYEFKDWQGMATVTKRPVVLVIGAKKGAYENVFHSAARGLLPYKKAWLAEGEEERIDKYSLKELKRFDGLILYGYSYKNKRRTFSLLDRYVKEGGRLFIDTGWQFFSQDWELTEAPDFLPVTSLHWGTEVSPGVHALPTKQAESLGLLTIPLDWENQAWGLSLPGDLRDWAQPILTVDGKTIAAGGDYGKGRVVWSGLNLFGYLSYHRYDDELVEMGASIFSRLFPEVGPEEIAFLTFKRDFPDRVEISLDRALTNEAWLLWREPYSPDWRVLLEDGRRKKLSSYRTGPGLLLLSLPETKGPAEVILEYKIGGIGAWGKWISLLTLGLFMVLLVDQLFLKKAMTSKVGSKFGWLGQASLREFFFKHKTKFKETWDKED